MRAICNHVQLRACYFTCRYELPDTVVIKVRARHHYRVLMANRMGRLWAWVGTAPWGSSLALMTSDVGFFIFYAFGLEAQLSTDV